MILASLFDVGFKASDLSEGLRDLGIGDVDVNIKDVTRKSISAKSFSFTSQAGEGLQSFKEISEAIAQSGLSPTVKERSLAAFDLLAEAESKIHGTEKEEVHFHEIGSIDSIVDIVGSFIGFERLGIQQIMSSPLALGRGYVDCEHGRLPVPAPATLEIARGLPVRGWEVDGELTTPTGAAILKASRAGFGSVPAMVVSEIGYGAGSRNLDEIPNVLRVIVGEAKDYDFDRVVVVETNIDDMNPQFFSHIYGQLLASGALDVWVSNILMKKGRPGFLLSVLCERQNVSSIVDSVLSETTTSGLRLNELERLKLRRRALEVQTEYGKVKVKVFYLDSHERCVPEYEDCLRVARAKGIPISNVIEEAKNAFRQTHRGSP
jgi:uncharacterized protein (TIGR00299 family) protein